MFRSVIGGRLTFNAYVLHDRHSALIHTGSKELWPELALAIEAVLPLQHIDYIVVPHFEADECGALTEAVAATGAQVVTSAVGARQVHGFGLAQSVQVVNDGDSLELGPHHHLEFVTIPSEMHLWPGIIMYDRTTRGLFSSDFLGQLGVEAPLESETVDIDQLMAMREGNVPSAELFQGVRQRLLSLPVSWIAPGHGSVLRSSVHQLIDRYFAPTAG